MKVLIHLILILNLVLKVNNNKKNDYYYYYFFILKMNWNIIESNLNSDSNYSDENNNFKQQKNENIFKKIDNLENNNKSQPLIEDFLKNINNNNKYFNLILEIYNYFLKKISIPEILATIHLNGGDIKKSIKDLSINKIPKNPLDLILSDKINCDKNRKIIYFH